MFRICHFIEIPIILFLTFQNDHVFHVTRKISVHSIVCIHSVPLALFVMLEEELEREFSMKVIERKVTDAWRRRLV